MSTKSDEILKKMEKNIPATVQQQSLPAATTKQLSTVDEKELQDDYEFSRKTYKDLVEKGQLALETMMELAVTSEHPRAYEVLGGMLKNVSDMTDKLMTLHKSVDGIRDKKLEKNPTSGSTNVTNNNVFVGSTTDLQRMIIAQQKKTIDLDNND